ncbi:hypothetical protein KAT92_02595 [Candidatus Babeliales bacterium]|nr:hypothetical protein [Candidatus Babeliales bacterium]
MSVSAVARFRVLLFTFLALGTGFSLVHPIEITVIDKKTFSSTRKHLKLLVSLDNYEIIYKDSLKLSLASASWSIDSWRVAAEEEEEYLAPFKMRKKVYKKSFSILVTLKQEKKKQEKQNAFYLSCFAIDANEKLLSVIKRIIT